MPAPSTPVEVFLLEVILNNKAKMEVDWERVMAATGLKSVGGAQNKLRYLERDYRNEKNNGPGAVAPSTPSKKPIKRKATEENDDDNDNVDVAQTPKAVKTPKSPNTPKTPRRPRSKKPKVEKDAEQDDVADETDIKAGRSAEEEAEA